MFKRVLIATAVSAMFAAPAFADVTISGSAEMDLMYKTNQAGTDGKGKFAEEIAVVINVDGSDKLDSGDKLKWRIAQKVATPGRYDSFGKREAWIGYETKFGEVRFGNQFSNQYLELDGFASSGQGNLWADFGSNQVQYANGVSYFSPKFSGFSFAGQYDLGNGRNSARAMELTANYTGYGFNVSAGASEAKNSKHASSEPMVFGGNEWGHSGDFTVGAAENKLRTYNIDAAYKMGAFDFKAGYKRNEWNGAVNLNAGPGEKTTVDQFLVAAGYTMGKNNFNLGYQRVQDSKTDGTKYDDGMNVINAQYNYTLSKNTVAFAQVRHHMFDTAGQASVMKNDWQLDGSVGSNKKNATRLLVGTWTAF
ncbi:porin [Iodobacter sp. HSC-16F04]|uniref:Porin n=1 Tax=Iodobacter violaceini TaxID=3044271 RepID=A0ABX0L0Q0_9NEIS|nr:porin [Iodobacter violacea]NHQ87794.1 porin [Iodobacter violacea]